MALNEQQAKQLEELLKLKDQPAAPRDNRTVNFSVDLGDPNQVALARKMGLGGLIEEQPPENPDNPPAGDEPPGRKGYFGD